jgi:hypothetical protein
MPRATLTIEIPDDVWIGRISREHPEACLRVLSALPDDESGVGLVEVTADEMAAVLRKIDREESVTDLELLQQHGDTVLVQFETDEPTLLFPVVSSGIPLEMPFDIVAGEAVWEITTAHDRLSLLGEQLDAFNIPYTVEEIQHQVTPEQLLTDRQATLVQAAVENGYYDTPRGCTLTELAEAVDLAKSTCSETLHRAEGKIIKNFVENAASLGGA